MSIYIFQTSVTISHCKAKEKYCDREKMTIAKPHHQTQKLKFTFRLNFLFFPITFVQEFALINAPICLINFNKVL